MSKRKILCQRQIAKIAKRSIQNISDNDLFFLEEETSHTNNPAAIICSPNTNSSHAFLNDELTTTFSIINNYSMDLTQTNCDADNSVLQTLPTNVVLHPTRMAEIYIDSSLSESDQKSDVEPLVVRLRRWYCSSHANLTQLKMLLTELKPDHPDLPLDPRCIVLTPIYVNIKALNNGNYIHVGIKQGLVKRMVNGIKPNCLQLDIDINIDGLPISKSSSVDVWPILGRCIGLYDQRPFVIGLFCGSGKSEPLDLYLKDFIDELKELQNDEYLYAVVEFPPDNVGEKPQTAIVLKSWLLPNKKCWWPCHLKSDIAIQKALISKQEPGEGYMKCDFLRNLREYHTYKDARFGHRKSEVTSDLESNKEESLKSSRRRQIKRTLYEDDEEDDLSPKKTSVKAPPIISFTYNDSESRTNQACSKIKVKKSNIQKISKKVYNLHALKKDSIKNKLFKNTSRVVKKAVKAKLASELKQKLPLQKSNTNMMDKSPEHISTDVSRESAAEALSASKQRTANLEERTDIALPSKQSTISCSALTKEKSFLVTPLKKHIDNQKRRAHSTSPSLSKQWTSNGNRARSALPSPLKQRINSSASQSPVSSLSVSDFNAVDTSASSLSRSNIVDSSVNKSDIEDNLEDLQRNNHDTEHTHGNSNDSNADADHDNQVEASKKIIGIDIIKNLVSTVTIIKQVQRNHGILLEEILQRLRNKGTIVPHPEGMPQIPLENITAADKMEKCLASSEAQMEYLTKRLSTEG